VAETARARYQTTLTISGKMKSPSGSIHTNVIKNDSLIEMVRNIAENMICKNEIEKNDKESQR